MQNLSHTGPVLTSCPSVNLHPAPRWRNDTFIHPSPPQSQLSAGRCRPPHTRKTHGPHPDPKAGWSDGGGAVERLDPRQTGQATAKPVTEISIIHQTRASLGAWSVGVCGFDVSPLSAFWLCMVHGAHVDREEN